MILLNRSRGVSIGSLNYTSATVIEPAETAPWLLDDEDQAQLFQQGSHLAAEKARMGQTSSMTQRRFHLSPKPTCDR
jgi:hypothetical protein